MQLKQSIFFKIVRRILSMYFGVLWKLRYAKKLFGIENKKLVLDESYRYDQERFLHYAGTKQQTDWPFATADTDTIRQDHFRSILIKNYHCIEKAMALSSPHEGFGQKSGVIDRCIQDCEAYIHRFGQETLSRTTYDVLLEYRNRFGKGYLPVEQFLERHRSDLDDAVSTGGTALLRPEQLFSTMNMNADGFFKSRHSVRDYSESPVSKDIILKAVEYALAGTPSVCNRQPARLHVFSSSQEKADILRLQNGNRGFGDAASHILMVTSSLESFVDLGERNQCWISGGMFAMSLVYAFHAMHIATCVLNWDVLPENDKAMHSLTGIPESEPILMLISIGNYTSEFRVARSQRKDINDIVTFR